MGRCDPTKRLRVGLLYIILPSGLRDDFSIVDFFVVKHLLKLVNFGMSTNLAALLEYPLTFFHLHHHNLLPILLGQNLFIPLLQLHHSFLSFLLPHKASLSQPPFSPPTTPPFPTPNTQLHPSPPLPPCCSPSSYGGWVTTTIIYAKKEIDNQMLYRGGFLTYPNT